MTRTEKQNKLNDLIAKRENTRKYAPTTYSKVDRDRDEQIDLLQKNLEIPEHRHLNGFDFEKAMATATEWNRAHRDMLPCKFATHVGIYIVLTWWDRYSRNWVTYIVQTWWDRYSCSWVTHIQGDAEYDGNMLSAQVAHRWTVNRATKMMEQQTKDE